MRTPRLLLLGLVLLCGPGCDSPGGTATPDCLACTDPESASCQACVGEPADAGGASTTAVQDPSVEDVLGVVTAARFSFAVVGDTRPPVIDDTAGYPTGTIDAIWKDVEAERPHPDFALSTGDYQFSRPAGAQAGPQLDLYLAARKAFTGPEYPAMGNHECTGATASNCGPATTGGTTGIYRLYFAKLLAPLGLHNPYYVVRFGPPTHTWTGKLVFIAANAWTPAQAAWLDRVLAEPTTYTFIVRHESSHATTAPGTTPSEQILARHPYTLLLVGHEHTVKRLGPREMIIGNGGAPLTTGASFGYALATERADGTVLLTVYEVGTHRVLEQLAVRADGSPAP